MKMKSMLYLTLTLLVALLTIHLPVYASDTDDRIESSAKKSHVFKTYLKNDDIKVQSKDGAVTLKGSVSEESHKALAHDTVASLPGVKSVDNKLEIKGERPAENSDTWLMMKVKSTLLFHRSVSGTTEVDVKGGVVTLRGDADSQAQKELTTEYARDIEGVKDVNNQMTVPQKPKTKLDKAGDTIDDASITALVKMTLLYHRSTSALKTSVKTDNGVVVLTGKAANTAEKDLATKLANDVNGVRDVKNRMTVE